MAKVKQMTPWEVPTIYSNDDITGYSLTKEILQAAQANGTTAVLHSRRGVQNFSLDKLAEKLKTLNGHELRTILNSFVSATEYSRNDVVFTFPWGFVRAYGGDLGDDLGTGLVVLREKVGKLESEFCLSGHDGP
jgi:hypothetical protein